jgi:nanoRNase/pAp phosphatase (c-di-AMP/oligoRNAs hydrolase)
MQKYRLITRSDFDGLVCAVLLRELDLISEILFVHPKDMQDAKIAINTHDITTNLPFVPGSHLVFDHHDSETKRAGGKLAPNHIIDPQAPSAARVVYDYYGGVSRFKSISKDMMAAVDKGDAAQFSRDEILNPEGWVILNFLMDSRTGLGRFHNFRISNYQLMMKLIDSFKNQTLPEILADPDINDRVELYHSHKNQFKEQLQRCATIKQNLILLDLREEETIYSGNRFMIYALFPECNISIHVLSGFRKQNVVYAIGKSILDRSSKTHIGELCLEYGGGGHNAAGTCQIDHEEAPLVLQQLIQKINADG